MVNSSRIYLKKTYDQLTHQIGRPSINQRKLMDSRSLVKQSIEETSALPIRPLG